MQNLINALNNGIHEYKDNGEVITRPPTATMIRAAKALAQLANINEQNAQIIVQQQQTITQQLQEIEQLRNGNLQSSSPAGQEANNLGSTDSEHSTSDPGSATNAEQQ